MERRRIHRASNLNVISDRLGVLHTTLAERMRAHRIRRRFALTERATTNRALIGGSK